MDFSFTPDQDEAAELAASILRDQTSNERLKEVEAGGDRFDRRLWALLCDAFDWSELDLITLARVVVEVGRHVAPVPLATHAACVAMLGRHADTVPEHRLNLTTPLYAAAVAEERAHLPERPTVTADASGAISGVKTIVRAGMSADALLVTAGDPDGAGVYLVAADAAGVRREAQHTSDGDVAAMITFEGAAGERIGDVAPFHDLLVALAAAEQLGATEGALRLTAGYAKTREQFGRPIGTFQAVSQRLADGYIDVLAQRLTLWQAVWRLSEGRPASTEVAVAKLWAADAGHRLAHTTAHVHGGVGIDLDGEAHRYFTSPKRFELLFGGATEQALKIGRTLATAGR